MLRLYDVPAPAKLNLFLHLTGRRPDGYHLLQSVFMLIDWQDTLHFERRTDGVVQRQDLAQDALHPSETLPAEDLVVRAARALQAATGCTLGADIQLHKRIPAQAGMGGGSSDAASTLLALNRLWDLHLPRAALERIGLALGADVPFFLRGRNAWVEGVGERITPLEGAQALPAARFVVVKPDAGLETKAILSAPDLQRNSEHATIAVFAADHYGFGHNDLQPVAETLCSEVKKARLWLESQNLHARMTGSGSAVFAQEKQAIDLSSADRTWQIRVCNNLDIHPLQGWVSDAGC